MVGGDLLSGCPALCRTIMSFLGSRCWDISGISWHRAPGINSGRTWLHHRALYSVGSRGLHCSEELTMETWGHSAGRHDTFHWGFWHTEHPVLSPAHTSIFKSTQQRPKSNSALPKQTAVCNSWDKERRGKRIPAGEHSLWLPEKD